MSENEPIEDIENDEMCEPWITRKEVARRLRCSERSIANYMREGYLPYHKFGHNVYFKWSEIQHTLRERFYFPALPGGN